MISAFVSGMILYVLYGRFSLASKSTIGYASAVDQEEELARRKGETSETVSPFIGEREVRAAESRLAGSKGRLDSTPPSL